MPIWRRRTVFSWALYDLANSAFATTVMAGFFKQFWASDLSASESTFLLGNINAFASILVVLLAPILGAIADHGGAKKRFLFFFAAMGIVMTGGLYLVAQGYWAIALALYAMGVIGFSGSIVFYDALMIDVVEQDELDFVSALGFAAGYLGGGILFSINVIMVLYPSSFGLPDEATAVRLSFLSVAIWWALFSIPVFLFVKETRPASKAGWLESIKGDFSASEPLFTPDQDVEADLSVSLGVLVLYRWCRHHRPNGCGLRPGLGL
ncbi:MFS transporter [Solemya velesiana gill symbiont]|uniref:MFS transporter n=1 Tax=Solemya velesiana gill symbiont TaxID=1918948 RepID=UPI0026D121DE